MKKLIGLMLSTVLLGLMTASPVWSQETSNEQLIEKIQGLKERIVVLEGARISKTEAQEPMETKDLKEIGGDRGLKERLNDLESRLGGVKFSGAIEVEAGYTEINPKEGADTSSSDISVATVEFGVDAQITDHVGGHILFLYEDDEDVVVDEAIIHIHGEGAGCTPENCKYPWQLSLGKLYIPFGYYESHFISDPLTLVLGETRESAIVGDIGNDWATVSVGVFNGEINQANDSDDHIDNYVASVVFTFPNVMAGASYTSNIATSNELIDQMNDVDGDGDNTNDLNDYVAGYSAFASINLKDKFFIEAEYLAAIDEFEAGELLFDSGQKYQPSTWNLEFAYAATDDLELGIRYAGSNDGGDFLPDEQYGGVVSYGIFENTSLAVEYQYSEFENDDKETTATAQLAIEF